MVYGPLGKRAMGEEELLLEACEDALELGRIKIVELSRKLIFDGSRNARLNKEALERGLRFIVAFTNGASDSGF